MERKYTSEMVQQYKLDEDETPTTGVISVIAAVENCSPLDLPPLAKAMDPDALDAILATGHEVDHLSFEYYDYEVTATPDEIRVEESVDR